MKIFSSKIFDTMKFAYFLLCNTVTPVFIKMRKEVFVYVMLLLNPDMEESSIQNLLRIPFFLLFQENDPINVFKLCKHNVTTDNKNKTEFR